MRAPQPLVLYVDDERANRLSFSYIFDGRFRIALAADGSSALRIIEKEVPAVLLTDHRMPRMTGVELCEEVRQRHPTVIRMIVTAYADLAAATAAINQGAVHRYLRKPYEPEVVREALSWGLAQWRERRAQASLESQLRNQAPLAQMRIWHELNNLLQPLRTHLYLLGESLDQASLSDAKDLYTDLVEIEQSLAGFVAELRSSPRGEGCDGGEVVERACRLFLRDHPKPVLTLRRAASPQLPIGAVRLTQVLFNLCRNAQRVGADVVHIHVFVDQDGSCIEVTDDGPGVPEGLEETIFDEGYTSDAEGHGLGLYTSRALIEQAGGTLGTAPSTRGACFRIRFPPSRGTSDSPERH